MPFAWRCSQGLRPWWLLDILIARVVAFVTVGGRLIVTLWVRQRGRLQRWEIGGVGYGVWTHLQVGVVARWRDA